MATLCQKSVCLICYLELISKKDNKAGNTSDLPKTEQPTVHAFGQTQNELCSAPTPLTLITHLK